MRRTRVLGRFAAIALAAALGQPAAAAAAPMAPPTMALPAMAPAAAGAEFTSFVLEHSGQCLTADDDHDADGTAAVVQRPCQPAPGNDKFSTVDARDGRVNNFTIESRHAGRCLTAPAAPGAAIIERACADGADQLFTYEQVDAGPAGQVMQIRGQHGGCLTVADGSAEAGKPLILEGCQADAKRQRFTLTTATVRVDRLLPGQRLTRGGAGLTTADGRFSLTVAAATGELALYENGFRKLWGTGPLDSAWMLNQPDGNLVAYRTPGHAVWHSETWREGPSTLILQNDGNLVLYRNSDGGAVWHTNTWRAGTPPPPGPTERTDRLLTGQAQVPGGVGLTSADGRFTLVLQDYDGNLVLYKHGSQALWSYGARPVSWVVNQPDGNVAAFLSEGPSAGWATGTNQAGPSTLILQNDGNLVLYRNSDNAAVWHTHTWGH